MDPHNERPSWIPPDPAPTTRPFPQPTPQEVAETAGTIQAGGGSAYSTSPVPSGTAGHPPPPPTAASGSTNGFAVASLILGIIGCSLLTPVLAIAFGLIGRRQIKKSGGQQKGLGLATAGTILGASWITFFVIIGGLGAAGVFDDSAEAISRGEFVRKVSDAMESDPAVGFGDWPEGSRADVRIAFQDYASCVYDVVKDDKPYLEAVFENPTDEATIYGMTQSEIDALDNEVERVCVEQLSADLDEIPGD